MTLAPTFTIGLRLDLAGAAHDRGQVLLDKLGSQHLGIAGLLLDHVEGDQPGNHEYA